MRNYKFIKEQLIKRHETIDSYEYLEKYINFLLNYKLDITKYSEKHHILPRTTFPEFQNEYWNLIELNYEDHKLVHLLLFKSINIRTYQKPLNWMMNYYKNHEEISNASKKGWVNLKNNKEKYEKWRESKSESMKKLSSEEQMRRANLFWNNITDKEYLSFCNQMKDYWTDEKKKEKSEQMIKFYTNPENVEKKKKETKYRWDSMDEEYRMNFKQKMNLINKDESKRLDASKKIKEIWRDPIYLEKMKNRKKKPGLKIKIIKSNNEFEIFENMEDVVKKYNFSAHLIRKYRDKDKFITEKDLKKENMILLNCKIETIKE